MRRILAAAVGAVLLVVAGSAGAQTRRDALGSELIGLMLTPAALETMMGRATPEFGKAFSEEPWWRPEWTPLFDQAFREEFRADLPKLQTALGREMTRGMSEQELEAGLAVFRTEGGRLMIQNAATGGDDPKLTRAQQAEMAKVSQGAAAEGFFAKMGKLGEPSPELMATIVQELLPGMFRRFGEKAEGAAAR